MTTAARPRPQPRPAAGIALLEALIALLVVAVGLLALGTVYLKLARGEDVARQRGEAVRLAEETIEAMRGYTQIEVAAGVSSWRGLASGQDRITTNTTYTRTWTLSGTANDPMRTLMLEVGWLDRRNEPHSVRMSTVISRTDPADVGALGVPLPDNTTLKRPKNRNLNIPVPANDLGNGESAFRMPGTSYAIVFSNDSGWIIKRCALANGVSTITLADLSGCTEAHAYVLAGYVSLDSRTTLPAGLALDTSRLAGTTGSTCSMAAATDQNSGAAIAGYRYYVCVISVAEHGDAWSGSTRLAAPALNSGSDGYLVCRFQYAAAAGVTANQRHVQPYAGVAESLDNQNFILTSGNSCPTVDGLATTLHQSCTSRNGNRASDCPSAAGSPA